MTEEMKCAYCGKDLSDDNDCGCKPTREQKAKMHAWEEEMIKLYGFYIHYVPHDPYADCHTHGLRDSMNHPEVQLVVPLPGQTAMHILHNVVDKIREGHNLEDQEKMDKVIDGSQVLISKMNDEEGTEYFRIIFPDENGLFPDNKHCAPFFLLQRKEGLVW